MGKYTMNYAKYWGFILLWIVVRIKFKIDVSLWESFLSVLAFSLLSVEKVKK